MRDLDQLTPYEKEIGYLLDNSQIIKILVERLYEYVPGIYLDIDKSTLKIEGDSLGGQFAQTFKLKICDKNKQYNAFAKICPVYQNLDPALKEYETLEIVHSKMPAIDTKYQVSKPLVFFRDLNCYVMESVGNQDLRTFILKNNTIYAGNSIVDTLNQYIKGSAEWLALFHKITSHNNTKYFEVDNYIGSFTEDFDYTDLSQFSFSDSIVKRIENIFHALDEIKLPMPLARWHWDYTPGHVYIDNGKISVIDILGIEEVSVFEDIGHYIASVSCVNNLPRYIFFDRNRASYNFNEMFLDSYCEYSGLNKPDFLLLANIYRLKYLITYFIMQHRQVQQRLGRTAAKLFSNTRGVFLFEKPIIESLVHINNQLSLK